MSVATSSNTFGFRDRNEVRMAEAAASNLFAEQALEQNKRESLDLAIKARWVALAIVAVMLPVINPSWGVLYYEVMLIGFALIGWVQRRIGRVGQSRAELALIFCDLALMAVICLVPSPFAPDSWPAPMQLRFNNFPYFFILLAVGTLAYSWRTIFAIGTWTVGLWTVGVGVMWWFSDARPDLTAALKTAFAGNPELIGMLDPASIQFGLRIQEVVIFLIVAFILAQTVRRSNQLLVSHAAVERERANLARYFSPNVVEELSHNDEPLKRVRTQDVAVLFVDIVGFTEFSAGRPPQDVIETLRVFHSLMETEVFAHSGTLDKYLGDGLMATFGTPLASDNDAGNALRCARRMLEAMAAWNAERTKAGDPEIRIGTGLHYGPVVLGDIGSNRLEFAVIGNTVNIANRLEALTRPLDVALAASDDLVMRIRAETASDPVLESLEQRPGQTIRGMDGTMTVWTLD